MTARELAARVLRLEAEAILALIDRLDESFDRAVDVLHRARGRVIVTGMGKSGLIGRKIAATLSSTGTPAHFVHPGDGMHGDLGRVAPGDAVLGISNSGETDEMLAILPRLKVLGTPIVLMTGNVGSALARQADVVLDASVAAEACPLNLAPTASTTAVLALGDALAMALLDRTGFRPEDYAALHPRGTLGWRSLFRVRDLMLRGDAIPIVQEDTALKDLIVEMTAKTKGVTGVVDGDGRLSGVITDGDIRRLLVRGEAIEGICARDFMTRNAKLVDAGELAAVALERMESFPITSLFVVDDHGRPAGVIHMHDILRAKIV